MSTIYGYSQPPGATKETVWEEFRVDSTFTVMFQWKGMQLATERVELKYALSALDINENFISSLQENIVLYKYQISILQSALEERAIDMVIADEISKGNIVHNIDVKRKDEIGDLYRSIKRMQNGIQIILNSNKIF